MKSKGWNQGCFRIKFQLTLVTLIVIILCLSSFSILFAVLSISRTVSTQKAAQLFEETGYRVEAELNRQMERAIQLSRLFSTLPRLSVSMEEDGRTAPVIPFMINALETYPNLYSLYIGATDGRFLQCIRAAGDPEIVRVHQAPGETAYILRAISFVPVRPVPAGQATPERIPDRREYWTFFNREMEIIGAREVENPDYDPTQRIWFTRADTAKNQVILTEPYLFNSLKAPGLTASVRAHDSCIVGVDMTLANLKAYLEGMNISEGTGLLIVDGQDRILTASARMETWLGIRDSALKRIRDVQNAERQALLKKRPPPGSSIFVTGTGTLIWNRHWQNLSGHPYRLIIVTPMSDFTAHLALMKRRIVLTTLCLILLVFPFAVIGSRRLSRFLEVLALDAGRIQRFDFGHDIPGHSLILEFEQLARAFRLMKRTVADRTRALETTMEKLERIIQVGISMSVEKDSDRLVELILKEAKELANADGGSLYLKTCDNTLDFKIVLTDSIHIAQGGTSGRPVTMPPVPLFDGDGKPNHSNVASCAYHTGQTVSIDDAYEEKNFRFTGTREFDEINHYQSRSLLTVPLTAQGGEVIGVLQLINSVAPDTREIVPFSRETRKLVEALSAEAAAVLSQRGLLEAQNLLFQSLIRLIADAIDIKSPYTGRHCSRVPALALMLAEEAEACTQGPLADFRFEAEDDRRAFEIGAWLHDAGKMTTPEFVVDKAVKLETLYNRIHEIRTRFEVLLRDVWLEEKEALLKGVDAAAAREACARKEMQLKEDFSFVARCNIGSEEMPPGAEQRLHDIAARTWVCHFDPSLGLSIEEKKRLDQMKRAPGPVTETLLSDKPEHRIPFSGDPMAAYRQQGFNLPKTDCLYNRGELHNLLIPRGTLTTEERFKINEHIMQTSIMLGHLPFPKSLEKVPEYAVNHHETLDGKGYPRGLAASDLSVPSRIMAIADVFEALTAADRPYKKAKTLSEALFILHQFKRNRQIDPALFDLFLTSGVYLRYAEKFLAPAQIDEVDIRPFLTEGERGH